MIYLYAITEPGAALPDCSGLDGTELQALKVGGLAGLYSAHEQTDVRPEPDALWGHDQVVERAMAHAPALPARFGTVFPDVDSLAVALERDEAKLRAQLERVRGCVELAIRVGLPAGPETTPHDGGGYLQAKLADRGEQRAVAERTLVPLARLAVSSRTHDGREPRTLTASYLVREDQVERFAEQVRLLQRDNRELALSCTGPWPPYSFTSEEEEAA